MGAIVAIVGRPNVGKSTLFNALTKSNKAKAANYPFATIKPNVGRVAVPDKRLQQLSKIGKSEKTIPTYIDFIDIAGLVKGASTGGGLGNKFLAHIREVDAIAHVVRCFEDTNITHVSSKINPIDDIDTISTELKLADLEILQNIQSHTKNVYFRIFTHFYIFLRIIKYYYVLLRIFKYVYTFLKHFYVFFRRKNNILMILEANISEKRFLDFSKTFVFLNRLVLAGLGLRILCYLNS